MTTLNDSVCYMEVDESFKVIPLPKEPDEQSFHINCDGLVRAALETSNCNESAVSEYASILNESTQTNEDMKEAESPELVNLTNGSLEEHLDQTVPLDSTTDVVAAESIAVVETDESQFVDSPPHHDRTIDCKTVENETISVELEQPTLNWSLLEQRTASVEIVDHQDFEPEKDDDKEVKGDSSIVESITIPEEIVVGDPSPQPFKIPLVQLPQRLSVERKSPIDANNNKNLAQNEVFFSSKDFDFLLSKDDKGTAHSFLNPVKDSVLLRFDPLLNQPVIVSDEEESSGSVDPPPTFVDNTTANNTNSTLLADVGQENEFHERTDKVGQLLLSSRFSEGRRDNDSLLGAFGFGKTPIRRAGAVNNQQQDDESCPVSRLVDVTMNNLDNTTEISSIRNSLGNCESDGSFNRSLKNKSAMAEVMAVHDDSVHNGETKILNESHASEDGRKVKELEEKEEVLVKRITEKDKQIQKMSHIIEEYEKSIAGFLAEKALIRENYEVKCQQLETERDANYQHLSSLESTFSDLHMKYEKSKQLIETLKKSEEALLADKRQSAEQSRLQEQRYENLKSHAMQQMEIANRKLKEDTSLHLQESTRLKALLKKEEITRVSLQEQLQQKSRECEELIKIWDELKTDPR